MDWIKRLFCILQKNDKTTNFLIIPLGLLIALLAGVGLFVMFCDSGTQEAGKWFGTLDTPEGKYSKQDTLMFIGWLMGGLLAAIGVLMIGRRADAQVENNKLIEKGHIEERFRVATEYLAKKEISARVIAFHQLYNLANEYENFRKNIFDTLCSHLRVTTGDPEYQKNNKAKPSNEIQTLLDILFKPENKYDNEEKGKAAFRKLIPDLRQVHLAGADLNHACLPQADLSDACLIGANMENAKLHKAIFSRTKMHGANLSYANMQLATFDGTKLIGSFLSNANMQGATLRNEVDLRAAHIFNLRMEGAVFDGASSPLDVYSIRATWQSDPETWHCVLAGGACSTSFDTVNYEFKILKQTDKIADISGIYNSMGVLKHETDNTVKFLKKYIDEQSAEDYQKHIQNYANEFPKRMTAENYKIYISLDAYRGGDATKWINEYNEVMNPTLETENK